MYPNMALTSADGDRCRIVSHGHFTESIYTPDVPAARRSCSPPRTARVARPSTRLEEENFAWIDFFWSTLGRSGDVGTDVGLIYADLSSPHDLDALAGNLVRGLFEKSHGPRWLRPVERALATASSEREVKHMARSERGTPDVTLSPKGRSGSSRLPRRAHCASRSWTDLGSVPADIGFIFGHTHKPFVEDWTVDGYPDPVGSATREAGSSTPPSPALTQGGAAVLLDDDLNAASLQFYRQTADGSAAPVQLLPPSGDGHPNPFHAALAASIQPAAEPWRRVTAAASDLVALRHRVQAALVQSGIK